MFRCLMQSKHIINIFTNIPQKWNAGNIFMVSKSWFGIVRVKFKKYKLCDANKKFLVCKKIKHIYK